MSQFINAKESLVTDAIDGLLLTSGERLQRLDGFPHIKVVIRADWDRRGVALISGGGSGHEPAHAGFVGDGMLTAAVCGEVFASPSVEAVLAGILAVTGPAGCLLIVKNYTGDRLNFGLAAERARSLGLAVAMVVVDDDVALPELPQPRGVAGTLLVHKIAGAVAAAGADLATVERAARHVIERVSSIGTSLDTCTLPGTEKPQRIARGMAELGLGIHGEPGALQVPFEDAHSAMNLIVDRLAPHVGDGPHVALLNNLGACTALEMAVLANALAHSAIADRLAWLIGPAPMMTSLDMHGFSVSVMAVADMDLEALERPVELPAWPGISRLGAIRTRPLPDGLSPRKPTPSANAATRALLERACELLSGAESSLNALDARSGDGDTGSTLATAARALSKHLDDLPLANPDELLHAIGSELSQTMGGTSGVILAIFFSAAGEASASGKQIREALEAGLARISEVGGASPGDRTLIDALGPALAALGKGLPAAAAAARAGANGTASIGRARAGRAAYVPEANLIGHNDPGAEAVALLFEGLAGPAAAHGEPSA